MVLSLFSLSNDEIMYIGRSNTLATALTATSSAQVECLNLRR